MDGCSIIEAEITAYGHKRTKSSAYLISGIVESNTIHKVLKNRKIDYFDKIRHHT
jgi:hypothetical protein